MPSARRFEAAAWLAAGVFLVAATISIHGLELQTPDSTQYAITARNLLCGDGFTVDFVRFHVRFHESVRHVPETHALLPPVLLAALFWLFGPHIGLVGIPGLFAVSATGLITFYLGRRVFSPAIGLTGCLLVLSNPTFFFWGATGNDDPLFACMYLASCLYLIDALHEGSSRAYAMGGVFGALALLVKMQGILWIAVACTAWLLAASRGQPRGGRRALLLGGPFVTCLGLYLARSFLAAGSLFPPSLRLRKVTPEQGWGEVVSSIRTSPTGPVEIFHDLGGARLLRITFEQLGAFLGDLVRWDPLIQGDARAIVFPGFLGALGVIGLLVQLHRRREFAALGIVSIIGLAALLAVLYHVETRYLLFLVPILLLAALGISEQALGLLGKFVTRPFVRGVAIAGLGALLLANAPFVKFVASFGQLPREVAPESCYDVIRANVPEGDTILTFQPESVTWHTERPAIVFPSGGISAVRRVAQYYDTRWLLARPGVPTRPASQRVADSMSRERDVEVVHRSEGCVLVHSPSSFH